MKPALYILSEGERDELFYERLCERLTGFTFSRPDEFRSRHGSNWKSALILARILLDRYRHVSAPQEIAVMIAIDNDRAPGHPGGRAYPRPLPPHDTNKEPRYPKLQAMVNEKLGADPAARNVHAVIAMPVEMIESWLLPLLNAAHSDESLPPFSEADSSIARAYYGGNAPEQLKDLREAERKARKVDLDTLFFDAADTSDLARLNGSKSFAVFREHAEVLKTVWKSDNSN